MVSLLLSLLFVSTGPYSAVVVDATTNQPIEAVSVRDPDAGIVTTTAAQGTFTFANTPKRVALSRLGYATLTLTLNPGSGRSDTLRLLPQSYVLDEVAVHTPHPLTLSSGQEGEQAGQYLLPGQSMGILLGRPDKLAPDQPCVITQVRLYLQDKPHEGRVRVRLTTLEPATANGTQAHPGSQDLLPVPFVLTTEQLAKAPKKELVIDLSAYNLLLPPAGLCLVLDILPTDPADEVSGISRDDKHGTVVHLALRNGQSRDLSSKDFPNFTVRLHAGENTWRRSTGRPTWTAKSHFDYAVRADVQLVSY